MRKLAALFVCAVLAFCPGGCQPADSEVVVDVIIVGGGEFPQFLVGRWKSETTPWEFVFEPDGTISSALIDSGVIKVTPSKRVHRRTVSGGDKLLYKLGDWTVQYSPENRELSVEIVVDQFSITKDSKGLKGSSTDWFVGPVSEDGTSWEADWFVFPKYFLVDDDGQTEYPFDPNSNPIATLAFTKE